MDETKKLTDFSRCTMISIVVGRGNNKPVTTLYKFYTLREMLRKMLQENRHCDLVQWWLRRKIL